MKLIKTQAKTKVKRSSQTKAKPKSLQQQLTNNARQASGAHKTVHHRQKNGLDSI